MKKNIRFAIVVLVLAILLLTLAITGVACTKPPVENPNEDPINKFDGESTEESTEDSTEKLTEEPTERLTEELTEEITEKFTEEATDEFPTEVPESIIAVISPVHGETVCVANQWVADYASNYSIGYSANFDSTNDIYHPLPITLSWADVGADCYRVRLATSPDFSDSQVVLTAAQTVSFNNPLPGSKYYWQVEALYEDKTDVSAVFYFKTADTPRTVTIEGVSSTRDIGGYSVSESEKIRFGMIYRSAYLHEITEKGLYQAREELGIRAELDLRKPEDFGAGASPLGDDIRYYNISGVMYGNIASAEGQRVIAQEFKVLADPNNYPIIIHCNLGRDRTGTTIMLILALCGVSEKDIYLDYELTLFSKFKDGTPVNDLVNGHFKSVMDYIKSVGNGTLQENTEKYLLSIGVTAEEIATIKSIMIEEVGKR